VRFLLAGTTLTLAAFLLPLLMPLLVVDVPTGEAGYVAAVPLDRLERGGATEVSPLLVLDAARPGRSPAAVRADAEETHDPPDARRGARGSELCRRM
jgi:hypothetical protein